RAFRQATASSRRPAMSPPSRSRARRRQEPLSTRLRRVIETERVGSRQGRDGPGTARTGWRAERPRQRQKSEGAAAALRRRLGTGR
ncbi:MAG: hypothetical protein ACRDZ5_03035, partial [Acidimicrobiales bacterium]